MVMPMQVLYRTATLECGHLESYYQWVGDSVTELMCHHCHHRRAIVASVGDAALTG